MPSKTQNHKDYVELARDILRTCDKINRGLTPDNEELRRLVSLFGAVMSVSQDLLRDLSEQSPEHLMSTLKLKDGDRDTARANIEFVLDQWRVAATMGNMIISADMQKHFQARHPGEVGSA